MVETAEVERAVERASAAVAETADVERAVVERAEVERAEVERAAARAARRRVRGSGGVENDRGAGGAGMIAIRESRA